MMLEDRIYLSESIQLDIFETLKVKFETPKRMNLKKIINHSLISLENPKNNKNIILSIMRLIYD